MNNNIVKFQDKELHTHNFNGLPGLSSSELANGLGYADESAVTRIYNRHSDEFTDDMVQTVNLTVRGLQRRIKVFSPRGCHLVAMFAHTPLAKEFRKWVLDVLDKKPVTNCLSLTQDHTILKTIGETVKKCVAVAVQEEIAKMITTSSDPTEPWEVSDTYLMQVLHNWHLTRNKADVIKMQELIRQNEEYKRRLSAIKQAVT